MFSNELKNLVISDTSKKYEEINKKILKFSKIYFYLLQNSSPQLIQIEKAININSKNFGEIKITQLLANQHSIIKELVRIINEIILEKINNEVIRKLEENSTETFYTCSDLKEEKKVFTNNNSSISSCKSQKNIYVQKIRDENRNKGNNNKCNYKKSNQNKSVDDKLLITKKLNTQKKIIPLNIIAPKTNNEFNGALTFLNISKNNISNSKPYEIYLKQKNENLPKNSINITDIVYKKKTKNKSRSCLKKNNNHISINNTIDEEKMDKIYDNNERLISNISNINEEESSTLPEILNKKKRTIKYRNEKIKKSNYSSSKNDNTHSYAFLNTLGSFSERSEEFKNNRRNKSCIFLRPNLYDSNRYNQIILKFGKHKVYSVPYINNGKINSPSKLTKKYLGIYHKKLNDYLKK
jgi:hypothetical protein